MVEMYQELFQEDLTGELDSQLDGCASKNCCAVHDVGRLQRHIPFGSRRTLRCPQEKMVIKTIPVS